MSTFEMGEKELMSLLEDLGARMYAKGIDARIYIVGGSAMLLAYGRDSLTRDIGAIFEPKMVIYEEAKVMAHERGISENWLNDGVKGFIPGPDPWQSIRLDVPGIAIERGSPERLLAMKIVAARGEQDGSDILRLCEMLGVRSIEQALSYAYREYGASFPVRSKFFTTELLQGHLPMKDPLGAADHDAVDSNASHDWNREHCLAPTGNGGQCRNPRESCPHHGHGKKRR